MESERPLRFCFTKIDAADPTQLGLLAGKTENDRGPVDILINNAGVALNVRPLDQSTDDWDWTTDSVSV